MSNLHAAYRRIYYGSDYRGTVCNSGDMEGKTGQYWPNPLYYKQVGSICLDSCPTHNSGNTTEGNVTSANQTTVWDPDAYIVCTCNNQLTIGQSGNTPTSDYSTELTCSQNYPTAHLVENSLNSSDTVTFLQFFCGR